MSLIFWNKIRNGDMTLDDQDESLKESWSAFKFAELNIPETDIEKCQEVACRLVYWACWFAKEIPGANIEYCQKHACKEPEFAYEFIRLNFPNVNLKYCQEYACKDPEFAYHFARNIPGADMEYCRKACKSDLELLKKFDKMIVKKVLE